MTVKEAAEQLEAALKTVPDFRAYRDPAAVILPPAGVVGAPVLRWESGCLEPTGAAFPVLVIVAADDRALERLWELVPQVSAALDAVLDAVVTSADPSAYQTGNTQLPAYALTVEVSL